jgi:hypothetical protein
MFQVSDLQIFRRFATSVFAQLLLASARKDAPARHFHISGEQLDRL